MTLARVLVSGACMLLLGGCATSSHVMLGPARPPLTPEQVKVYTQPPAHYEQIASIDASSRGSVALTSQQNMDKAIARLKAEAAKLGANGIVLQGVESVRSGSIGTGLGNTSFNGNTAVGIGLGGSFGLYSKDARGLAIYVPDVPADAAPHDGTQP